MEDDLADALGGIRNHFFCKQIISDWNAIGQDSMKGTARVFASQFIR